MEVDLPKLVLLQHKRIWGVSLYMKGNELKGKYRLVNNTILILITRNVRNTKKNCIQTFRLKIRGKQKGVICADLPNKNRYSISLKTGGLNGCIEKLKHTKVK